MCKSLQLTLCDMQGKLFILSGKHGYNTETFIKVFMKSQICADLDKDFNHMQWAGQAYIFSRIESELGDKLIKNNEIYDEETLYWAGYIYRYWHYYTGENSKEIYKQAPIKTMQITYFMYHTMSPEMAIDRLKDTYNENKISG